MANHDNCREVIGQFTSGRQQRPSGRAGGAATEGGMYGLPAADEGGNPKENTGQLVPGKKSPLWNQINPCLILFQSCSILQDPVDLLFLRG